MCSARKDETGNKHGSLTVVCEADLGKKGLYWLCKCDCGNEIVLSGTRLREGASHCGCLSKGIINEAGNRYGKLKVIERAAFFNNRKVAWVCICDCGNKTVAYSNMLRSGETRDCGFCSRKRATKNQFGNRMIDGTGNIYGRLTVLFYVRPGKRGEIRWCCRCECGNLTVLPGGALRTGNTQSCGCLEKENLARIHESRIINEIGNKHGKLTVIERSLNDRRGAFWLCRCDCGAESIVLGSVLRSGGIKSCGCLRGEMIRRRVSLPWGVSSKRKLLRSYKMSAKARKIEWHLTVDEFFKMTKESCHYCGTPPSQTCLAGAAANGGYIYNGIDRKEPSIGYISSNIVPCCSTCNYAKHAHGYDDFLDLIKRIAINMELFHD